MKMKKLLIGAGALAIVGGGLFLAFPIQMTHLGGLTISFIRNLGAPPGTTETNINPLFKHLNLGTEAGTVATETKPDFKAADAAVTPVAPATTADWPSYNRTLTSERFSQLRQIDTKNVGKLKVLCTYDTNKVTSFETAPIMVNNALIGTTEHDVFSLDPVTCRENWRTHEEYPESLLTVNRGAAYLDGRLFRGTQDGRVLAYDFKTGKRLWEATVADPKRGETIPSAPIAWNGLVFIGNAGGDYKGVKGRMYGLSFTSDETVDL